MGITNLAVNSSRLEEKTSRKYVKTSLDFLVLAILNRNAMYGYKIMAIIHKEFGVLLSPGSLYPLLHLLEKKELIKSRNEGGKRVYEATSDGKTRLQNAFAVFKISVNQLENFLKQNGNDSFNDS